MEQVLYNLVSDAAKYIPKYSVITLRAFAINEKLLLVVEDTGNGFPTDEFDKVSGKFYRIKGSATGGIVPGLSIVKGFVEAYFGTIRLENVPDCGAKFTIEIPIKVSY